MKIFGFDVSSLLTREVKYIITSYRFISSLSDKFPTFTSYSAEDRELRSLSIFKPPTLGFHFAEGYKFFINVKEVYGSGLNSLQGSDRILIYTTSSRIRIGEKEILIPVLNFLGFKKGEPYALLTLKDLSIIVGSKEELISEVKKILRDQFNIVVTSIPVAIDYVSKVKVKAKIEDIDYTYLFS